MNLPTITDADRAAGFRDWEVTFRDGRKETVRIFKPEKMRLVEILKLPTMTAKLTELVIYSSRRDNEFLLNLTGAAACEIYFAALGLNSQMAFDCALAVSPIVGRQLVCENQPGGRVNPTLN